MTEFETWKSRMRRSLAGFADASRRILGCEVDRGDNVVADAFDSARDLSIASSELREFYTVVGEVSLPDVHVGYFVHPAERLAVAPDWGLPRKLETVVKGDVETFGSDGGGGLFASAIRDGSIYYLPPGRIEGDVYYGGMGDPRVVGKDLADFLDALLRIVDEVTETGSTSGF